LSEETNITTDLRGEAREVGEAFGRRAAVLIAQEHARMNLLLDDDGRRRIERFVTVVEAHCPWWLDEVAGIAAGSGIAAEAILLANCMPFSADEPGSDDNCTSFIVMGDQSADGRPMMLKVRDFKPSVQVAGLRQVEARHRVVFGTNIDHLGYAYFVNDKGLVGGNNTGGPVVGDPQAVAFDDCHILRLVAETCTDVDEALDLVDLLVRSGHVGFGGWQRGVILLLMDARGKAVAVEASPSRVVTRVLETGRHVFANHFLTEEMSRLRPVEDMSSISVISSSTRLARGRQLMGEAPAKLTIDDLMRISRDEQDAPFSICNPTSTCPWQTVSAFACRVADTVDRYDIRIANGCQTDTEYRQWSMAGPL